MKDKWLWKISGCERWVTVHLVFSPPRPPMSFSALTSLLAHRATCCSSRAFSWVFSSKVCCSEASRSSTSFSSARFWVSSAMVVARDCWASARLAFLGATTWRLDGCRIRWRNTEKYVQWLKTGDPIRNVHRRRALRRTPAPYWAFIHNIKAQRDFAT